MTAPATTRLTDQVAEEIRALLGRRRLSASALAIRMGVTQRYISRRLTGEAPLDLNDIEMIARVLDVEPAKLLTNACYSRRVTNTRPSGRHDSTRPVDRRPTILRRVS